MFSSNEISGGATQQGNAEFALFTRRINSFNARGCGAAFAMLALVSLLIAVVFSALGAWLILPFAGLETVALYLAFAWVMRHAHDSEWLSISGDVVALAVRDQSQERRYEFNRSWAHLVVQERARDVRLVLRSHGREVEVGRYLDAGGRRMLARELKSRLRGR